MRTYRTDQIRNVALCGHSGSGKTTLVETLMHMNGVIPRLGSVDTGSTTGDYDPEEQHRRISINLAVLPVELPEHKINFIDCPGSYDFIGDLKNGLRVAEMALILVDAANGPEVGTEFAWEYAIEEHIPIAIYVTKMEKDRANFRKAMAAIEERFGAHCIPATLPIGEGADFKGVIDLLDMKAVYDDGGKPRIAEVPAELMAEAKAARRALIEAAAEGDDELTEHFLDRDDLTYEEIMKGLREDMMARRFVPVICGSPSKEGTLDIIQKFIERECPAPQESFGFQLHTHDGSEQIRVFDPEKPFSAFVFKTINDDYAGRLSLFKVVTGQAIGDGLIMVGNTGKTERVGHALHVRGKNQTTANVVPTGDIGAFAKLETVHTGDTIQDPKAPPTIYTRTPIPAPTAHAAIRVKNRGDEDKISMSLHRILESDPTLKVERDGALHQTIISGMGETHLDVAASRIKTATKVELELVPPRVQYRETLTRKSEGQGKYKKQSGGRGQYGDCHVRFEPLPRGAGFQFEWAIVGGVIPTNYKTSVEKGLVEALGHGILAGYPMVDVKAVCFHGSYHDVDSSDMAFQVAASMAFKEVAPKCGPVILEPYMDVEISVPGESMGDVLGYVSSHRGRISGNEQEDRRVVIKAQIPQGEMATFGRDLRSMTQGRSVFREHFSHYEIAPPPVQEKVIAEAKKHQAEAAGTGGH